MIQNGGGILSNGQTTTPKRPENYLGFGLILGGFELWPNVWFKDLWLAGWLAGLGSRPHLGDFCMLYTVFL